MVEKNIQMKSSDGSGGWDDLFPRSKSTLITMADGSTSVQQKFDSVDSNLNTKASTSNTYTKAEVDQAISDASSASDIPVSTTEPTDGSTLWFEDLG